MSRTEGPETEIDGMSTNQQAALAALRAGCSFPRAAEEAGVSRATVYRWVQRDAVFRAAYNGWQRELAESAHVRLLRLTDKAVEVVEKALDRNDEKTAVKLLKQLGIMRRRRAGSTDEQVLKLKLELKEKRELRRAEGQMTDYLMRKIGMPARERRRVIGGRATPRYMDELLALIGDPPGAPQDEGAAAADGETPGENPGEAPHAGHGEARGVDECNDRPAQEMQPDEGPPGLRAVGETEDETTEEVSHEQVA